MYVFVVTLHVILCVLLVLIILMQPGKGGDVSSAFGGGSSSQVFGAAGPGNFLTRGTGLIATLFMVTSISLALYGGAPSSTDTEDVERVLEEGDAGGGFGVGGAPAQPTTPVPAAEPAGEPPADGAAAPAPETTPAPAPGVAPAPSPDAAPAPAPAPQ